MGFFDHVRMIAAWSKDAAASVEPPQYGRPRPDLAPPEVMARVPKPPGA